ncbi:cytochrome c1 [Oceanospirillum maris]|jgi:ubiquinol-cytochrome c reductase cytochrome c1 subunit|uniref:cytochrome c1 n=1 Tax=Oceanospirillum maris TaxID=64977 RepID=UPI0004181F50|nr:cytochrome c1 [Oceanospirillum maris]
MKKQLIALILALVPFTALAAGGSVHLDKMEPDLYDKASLQNGAKLFVNYCMGCHSAEFQRYSRTAEDLGVPQDVIEENLIFNSSLKYNDQMRIGMQKEDASVWFGAAPPDLSLEARLRGPDWVYTYLRSFYTDPSRPWGVNNTVFPDVGMPNVLASLQGIQDKVCDPNHHVAQIDPLTGNQVGESCLKITQQGSMSKAEFDKVAYDLTNFLVYVGEPSKLESNSIAPWVLGFILLLIIVAYLLKKEYWRDIH